MLLQKSRAENRSDEFHQKCRWHGIDPIPDLTNMLCIVTLIGRNGCSAGKKWCRMERLGSRMVNIKKKCTRFTGIRFDTIFAFKKSLKRLCFCCLFCFGPPNGYIYICMHSYFFLYSSVKCDKFVPYFSPLNPSIYSSRCSLPNLAFLK